MITARIVLEQARDYHETFHRENVPDLALLRHLHLLEMQYAQRLARDNPEALVQEEILEIGDLEFVREEGLELSATLTTAGYAANLNDGRRVPVWLYPESDAVSDGPRPPELIGYRRGRFFFPAGTGWDAVAALRHTFTPVPRSLSTLDQRLTLPDLALPALVARLALWVASRRGLLRDLSALPQEVQMSEESFFATMEERVGPMQIRVRQVR
jgi:hypothetical protein